MALHNADAEEKRIRRLMARRLKSAEKRWKRLLLELEEQSDDWYTISAPTIDETYHIPQDTNHNRPTEDMAICRVMTSDLLEATDDLSPRERLVIYLRHGF